MTTFLQNHWATIASIGGSIFISVASVLLGVHFVRSQIAEIFALQGFWLLYLCRKGSFHEIILSSGNLPNGFKVKTYVKLTLFLYT